MSFDKQNSSSDFAAGLVILLLAQLFAAYQGAYVEETYSEYGSNWLESLFYCHTMSLPMFLPFSSTLQKSYARLSATPRLDLSAWPSYSLAGTVKSSQIGMAESLVRRMVEKMPQGIFFLLANALTQLACISGVNLLSAKSSAVTVTIVLNIRKLVSFIFSTILFGHQLSGMMVLGSTLVFGSGALYGWETSWRLPRERERHRPETKKKQ